jgi:preprotein translocase subunit Sec63
MLDEPSNDLDASIEVLGCLLMVCKLLTYSLVDSTGRSIEKFGRGVAQLCRQRDSCQS